MSATFGLVYRAVLSWPESQCCSLFPPPMSCRMATEIRYRIPDHPDVSIQIVNEAVLTAIAVTTRPPRGNPGEVSERAAEAALVAGKQQRKRVWL